MLFDVDLERWGWGGEKMWIIGIVRDDFEGWCTSFAVTLSLKGISLVKMIPRGLKMGFWVLLGLNIHHWGIWKAFKVL